MAVRLDKRRSMNSLSFILVAFLNCSGIVIAAIATSTKPPPQKFIREPHDQTMMKGSQVTLPCRVENKRGVLQWTRDGFGLGTDRSLPGFERYKMTGSDEEGEYTLDINPLTLEDDAKFQCQVGAAEGVEPIRSKDAVITVTVPPQPPEIINGAVLRTIEEREVEIECVSRSGKPAATITWLDGDGSVIDEGVTDSTKEIEGSKLVTAVSVLKLTAKKKHHNTNITCQAQNVADSMPKSTYIHMLVEYAPQVTITVDHTSIFEGEHVEYTCQADANPSQVTYRWFLDNAIVPENAGTKLVLNSIGRAMNNKIVKCEVNNEIGKSEETETIEISYSPKFITRPEDVSGDRDQDVTLRCLVDGSPTPSYTWFKNGDMQTVYGYDSNLTVTITPESIGKYICRASVKGFTEISSSATVLMKGPPTVIRTPALQYGSEGQDIVLRCEVFAIPPPETVIWIKDDFPIPTVVNGHYVKREEKSKDGMVSELTIREAIASDFGHYNCSVTNTHGQDSFVIDLQHQKSLTLIIVLSAIIGGIILTMFAILLTVMCRRASRAVKSLAGDDEKSESKVKKHFRPCLTTSAGSDSTRSTNGTTSIITSDSRSTRTKTTLSSSSPYFNGTSTIGDETHGSARDFDDDFDEEDDDENDDEETWGSNGDASDRVLSKALLKEHNSRQSIRGVRTFDPSGLDTFAPSTTDAYQQPPPPPPPPHPLHQATPSGSLNVMDPRYAAHYGNPYLMYNASNGDVSNFPGSPQLRANNNNNLDQTRGYATLNTRFTSSSGKFHSPLYPANGSLGRPSRSSRPAAPSSSASKLVPNGRTTTAFPAAASREAQFIYSTEIEAGTGALATHV